MGRAAGGVTRCIPLRPTLESAQGGISSSADWTLDYEKLESMFNERTRLIIVNTPNNPLGKVYTRAELQRIADLCQKTPAQLNETFHVGDYCACTINDKDWCRGVIRQLDSKGFATIFRIDYGDVQRIRVQFLRPFKINQWMFQTYRLAHHCTLSNIIKPINGWPSNVIDEFRAQLNRSNLYARFLNYNEIREISEVEIRVKGSTKTVNKDFERYQMERSVLACLYG
ncbi:unnamed protein product [Rotaria sp. Silwood1]|nr:unnamed protein product [Rotaria sp. Silwood1]